MLTPWCRAVELLPSINIPSHQRLSHNRRQHRHLRYGVCRRRKTCLWERNSLAEVPSPNSRCNPPPKVSLASQLYDRLIWYLNSSQLVDHSQPPLVPRHRHPPKRVPRSSHAVGRKHVYPDHIFVGLVEHFPGLDFSGLLEDNVEVSDLGFSPLPL